MQICFPFFGEAPGQWPWSVCDALVQIVPGRRWKCESSPERWVCDCTADEARRILAVLAENGIDCDDLSQLPQTSTPPAMTLRRWAGLRHATVESSYIARADSSNGEREVYRCAYMAPGDESGFLEFHYGPKRRNPIDAMEAAKEQDERRAGK